MNSLNTSVFIASIHLGGIMNTSANQIEFISSACPTTLRDNATVLDASRNVLREGTNGWTVSLPPRYDSLFESLGNADPLSYV